VDGSDDEDDEAEKDDDDDVVELDCEFKCKSPGIKITECSC
jgi:uncharacterized protein YuzB (UPF0349 family)